VAREQVWQLCLAGHHAIPVRLAAPRSARRCVGRHFHISRAEVMFWWRADKTGRLL